MSDSANTIITLVILIFVLLVSLFPVVSFFVYAGYQNWKRKNIRSRILSSNQLGLGQLQCYPARYASESRFNSWFKILPWNSAGLIVNSPQGWTYVGEFNSGQSVSVPFQPQEVTWLGKQPFPNGAVSWFQVTRPDGKHYFSSETGYFIFGSDRTTRDLCDAVIRWQQPGQFPPAHAS